MKLNKAAIFMNAGWVGIAGLAIGLVSAALSLPFAVVVTGLTATVLSTLLMLWARRADEFTISLWNAGASVAFGTMLLAFPGLPAAEGFYDGLTGDERSQDIPATVVPLLAIMAFYIGLFVKRLMGDA